MRTPIVSAVLVAAGLSVAQAQSTSPNAYRLGAATVVVPPPPQGFEDALKIPEVRDRFPSTNSEEVLAAYLPADVVRNFRPGQDLTFYATLVVPRAFRDADVSVDMITRLAQRTPAGETPDQRARREETEKQRQVAVAQPLHLGVFDQTPTSFSSMMLSTVTSETGSGNFLMSTSSIVARRRFVMVRAIRRSDTPKDRIALEDFTRTWVKAIIAANP